ncbi:MAG: ATP phosphoribosyltransferase [Hyphomicrobiaceae bacterium]
MTEKLILGLPSKGRLMEQTIERFAAGGLEVRRTGSERGYRGEIVGVDNLEVAFISASEIAWYLKTGRAHMGVTGEDLVRERTSDWRERVKFLMQMGFGHADVVVAVPNCWLDVRTMQDLDELAVPFHREHGRWYRVATKYLNLTREYFAKHGLSDYRTIESLGATEGAPGAGTADLIVDITSTGQTLKANGLRILDDGVILQSQANLISSNAAEWSPSARQAQNEIMLKLGV